MKNFGKIRSLKTHSLLLLLLLFASYESVFVPSSALVPVEQDILLGIKEVWNDPGQALLSWIRDNDCSYWNGITCDENGHVKIISFFNYTFSSYIPSSLGGLTNLQYLTLKNNNLSGPIPDSFSNLKNLIYIDLGANKFSGPFPPFILTLKNFEKIYLDGNMLNGTLPASIGNLINLVEVKLNDNQFSGPIPSTFGVLTNLELLWLYGNQLSGPIPSPIGELVLIKELLLNGNYFNGSAIDCVNYCDQSGNCLTDTLNPQRASSQCSSFCDANSSTGPCGGHGICAFNASNIPFCTCSDGWLPPDCQPKKLTPYSSPPPSPSPSPSKSSKLEWYEILAIIGSILGFLVALWQFIRYFCLGEE